MQEVGVDDSHRQILVPKPLLYGAKVGAMLAQVCGEGIVQGLALMGFVRAVRRTTTLMEDGSDFFEHHNHGDIDLHVDVHRIDSRCRIWVRTRLYPTYSRSVGY